MPISYCRGHYIKRTRLCLQSGGMVIDELLSTNVMIRLY